MADAITTALSDMAPHTLVAQPVTEDEKGDYSNNGSAVNLEDCRISGRQVLVRDERGREVVSSRHVIVLSSPGLTVHNHRYTLPATEPAPRTLLRAIAVKRIPDENGAHHEKVFFP